jgi:cytochrome P450
MRPTAPELTAPLTDPAFYAGDPFPLFARLRAEAPVVWHDWPGRRGVAATADGFWVVSRHADVLAVSKDPVTFCSGRGILLLDLGRELPELPGAILYVDPPEHGRYRRLIQPAFAPSRIRALEPAVRRRAVDLLDALPAGEPVDVVERLAVPYPLVVIADLLGVDPDRWRKFYEWSDAAIAAGTEQTEENLAAIVEMSEYFVSVIAAKTQAPGEDLISTLVTAEIDGERLREDEMLMLLGQLLVAGNETTRNLVAGGLVALAEHPDQWARLVADPSLLPTAVEELLRWTTPVISFMRTATRDTELGGQRIHAGDPVLLLYSSANRDEAEFGPTAGELDLGREPNHQLAFGFGEHYCLGAGLARLEGRVLFEELLRRFSVLEPAGPVRRLESAAVVAGVLEAPMVLR